ncbi:MAG: hypothetical protein IT460_06900 [Planctomycetes bacterium]|nr:hypothetical protein [Planctomycetota bacterium]
MRTHRVLRPIPVDDDFLLTFRQVGKRLGGMNPRNVGAYVRRWPVLLNGLRYTRTKPGTRGGQPRVLRSALIEHMHRELVEGAPIEQRPAVPA